MRDGKKTEGKGGEMERENERERGGGGRKVEGKKSRKKNSTCTSPFFISSWFVFSEDTLSS